MKEAKQVLIEAIEAHNQAHARKAEIERVYNVSRIPTVRSSQLTDAGWVTSPDHEDNIKAQAVYDVESSVNQVEIEAAFTALQKAKEAYKAELLNPPVHVPAKPDRRHIAKNIADFRERIMGVDLTPEEFRKILIIVLERFYRV